MSDVWGKLHGEHILNAIRMDVRHPFDPDAGGCALALGDLTIFVFEEPNDGYRSAAIEPFIIKQPFYTFTSHASSSSTDRLHIPVLVQKLTPSSASAGAEGIEAIDQRNGKLIIRLGTDNSDDYYPIFICEWTPQNIAENDGGVQP